MNINKALILLLAVALLPFSAQAYFPFGGATVPVGGSAGSWSPGYAVGVETSVSSRHGLDWHAVFSAVRVTPNAVDLLRTEGRELKVEKNQGWSLSLEASLLASKTLFTTANDKALFRVFGGAGLFYLQDADVFVGGFQPVGSSAVNRQRRIEGQTLITPGITLGIAGLVAGSVEPTVRLQHIFTGDTPRDYLLIGLNLLPR